MAIEQATKALSVHLINVFMYIFVTRTI